MYFIMYYEVYFNMYFNIVGWNTSVVMPRCKNLLSGLFQTDNIIRPACFVPTTETKGSYIRWCKNKKHEAANPIRFWCFPYEYCDRSRWNTISSTAADFINIPRELRESISKIATFGIEGGEEEEDSDSSESSNEDDI